MKENKERYSYEFRIGKKLQCLGLYSIVGFWDVPNGKAESKKAGMHSITIKNCD